LNFQTNDELRHTGSESTGSTRSNSKLRRTRYSRNEMLAKVATQDGVDDGGSWSEKSETTPVANMMGMKLTSQDQLGPHLTPTNAESTPSSRNPRRQRKRLDVSSKKDMPRSKSSPNIAEILEKGGPPGLEFGSCRNNKHMTPSSRRAKRRGDRDESKTNCSEGISAPVFDSGKSTGSGSTQQKRWDSDVGPDTPVAPRAGLATSFKAAKSTIVLTSPMSNESRVMTTPGGTGKKKILQDETIGSGEEAVPESPWHIRINHAGYDDTKSGYTSEDTGHESKTNAFLSSSYPPSPNASPLRAKSSPARKDIRRIRRGRRRTPKIKPALTPSPHWVEPGFPQQWTLRVEDRRRNGWREVDEWLIWSNTKPIELLRKKYLKPDDQDDAVFLLFQKKGSIRRINPEVEWRLQVRDGQRLAALRPSPSKKEQAESKLRLMKISPPRRILNIHLPSSARSHSARRSTDTS